MIEDPNKVTYFASTDSRGKAVPFGIKRIDRARHMYVIGKTGMGKSTMLENMAIQDIRNGEGIAFVDPHGSTAEKLLEYVPEHRIDDVLYFAPFDMEYPVAFNVMEDVGFDKRHLVVSGLMSAFKKIWEDAWSARMEYILSNTLLALLEYPDSTLLDVNRMLIVKNFRKKVVEHITDPIVKSFWVDEFANYSDRYTQDATPAIQNKIGQFTSNPLIRNIVGQPKSSFDIRDMMDQKKIMIINLSKGRVGEGNASLLGSMLVTKIYLAAMSRADLNAKNLKESPHFYFYVDEFQSFANQSFADILSEARKYKLNLTIAHQYIEQMEEEVRDAVFGNVGTTIAFRVGPFDAEVLETVFTPKFTIEDLVNLGFAQIYLTLMIDGVGSQPFSATTLAPFDTPPQIFTDVVLANSRRIFGAPRAEVEAKIDKWQTDANEPPQSDIEKEKAKKEVRDFRRSERQALGIAPGAPLPESSMFPNAASKRNVGGGSIEEKPVSAPTPAVSKPAFTPLRPLASGPRPAPVAPRPPAPSISRPPSPRPVVQRPMPPRAPEAPRAPVAPRPPLEGSTSLKDALMRVTAKDAGMAVKSEQPLRPSHPVQKSKTLSDALSTLAPEAKAPEKSAPESATHKKRQPAVDLSEDVLRKMLQVDEHEA